MSDFGSIIVAKKEDSQISSDELSVLTDKLEIIIKDNEYSSVLGETFNHVFVEEENSFSAVCILSEYFYDDDEDDTFEFIENSESPTIDNIVSALSQEFPELDFEGKVEEW